MTPGMRTIAVLVALVFAPAVAFGQSSNGEPPANVRMHIGPLYVNPTLALTNAGRDTNVFNDATNPQSDFTVTITPATDLWLRVGPSWVQSNIREDIVWFNRFAGERSANNSYQVKWIVPLNRLTITPIWTYTNTRERPGFEIDARAERTENSYGGVLEYRLLSKTFVGVDGRRTVTDFDQAATFLGTNLHAELNRTGTSAAVTLRHQLTPLTAFVVGVTDLQDRFDFDRLRNSETRLVTGGIRFDPAALIKGSASFGYEEFKPASSDVSGYKGSSAAVDLNYVLVGVTKFSVQATRNVQYSYDVNQPYYVLTGGTASISQQIFGPLDIVVRGGLQRLEYRDRVGAIVPVADRVDHQTSYGGGIGYHLGRDTRIGVNIDQSRRDSAVSSRQYKGLVYGVAVTYTSSSS
jgi:hypothetical protein